MPKVSIIIPVYGVEKYIERCVRSLFEQTLDDIEYLFIDDCSPDRSIDILNRIIEEYPNRKSQILIHRMESNSGQAKVREWGTKNANGEYIIHCDSDDWVDIHMYEKLYNKALSENLDLVMCNYCVTDGIKQIPNVENSNITNLDKDKFVNGILTARYHRATWNKLIKREIYSKLEFFPTDNMWEDVAIITQLSFFCERIGYLNEVLYYYYLNPNSISAQKSVNDQSIKLQQVKNNINQILNFLSQYGLSQRYQKEITAMKFGALSYAKSLSRETYLSVYPNDNFDFLVNQYISIHAKIGHFLRIIGIWYLIKK